MVIVNIVVSRIPKECVRAQSLCFYCVARQSRTVRASLAALGAGLCACPYVPLRRPRTARRAIRPNVVPVMAPLITGRISSQL